MPKIEVSNLVELQAVKDALAGDYEVVNDIDADTSDWNELLDAGAWADDEDYTLVANVSHDRVTHGGSAYYALQDSGISSDIVEPGVTAGWEAYWQLTTLAVGHKLGFVPIGTSAAPFTGTFDGGGFTISNLYINRPVTDDVGLFGAVNNTGLVLKNITVSGNVTGKNRTGILAGQVANGNMDSCYTSGEVAGADRVGGVIGYAVQGARTYKNSGSSANVTSSGTYAGGFAGGSRGIYTNCYATGNVVSSSAVVGGLIGSNVGATLEVHNCYATGNVTGTDRVGGLVGWGFTVATEITNSYATGDVTGNTDINNRVGGFIGYSNHADDVITNSYSTGTVNNTGTGSQGGFCGENSGTITNCFWDTESSGVATSDGGTGLTTAEMKRVERFQKATWSMKAYFNSEINNGYPFLAWEIGAAGIWLISGTISPFPCFRPRRGGI